VSQRGKGLLSGPFCLSTLMKTIDRWWRYLAIPAQSACPFEPHVNYVRLGKERKSWENEAEVMERTCPLSVLNLTSRMAGLFAPVPSAKPGSRGETAGASRIHDIGRPVVITTTCDMTIVSSRVSTIKTNIIFIGNDRLPDSS